MARTDMRGMRTHQVAEGGQIDSAVGDVHDVISGLASSWQNQGGSGCITNKLNKTNLSNSRARYPT